MGNDKADRLHALHKKLEQLLKELQEVQFEIWDLCQDMKSDSLMEAVRAASEVKG